MLKTNISTDIFKRQIFTKPVLFIWYKKVSENPKRYNIDNKC